MDYELFFLVGSYQLTLDFNIIFAKIITIITLFD